MKRAQCGLGSYIEVRVHFQFKCLHPILEPFPYAESEFHNFAVIRMADDYAGQNELLFYFGKVYKNLERKIWQKTQIITQKFFKRAASEVNTPKIQAELNMHVDAQFSIL